MSTPIADKVTGQVKWFNTKTGYGFITVIDKGDYHLKDVFAHYSNLRITHSQYKYLVQGEYVEFDIVKTDEGAHEFHAVNVSGIRSGDLLCEVRYAAEKEREKRTNERPQEGEDWQNTGRAPTRRVRRAVTPA